MKTFESFRDPLGKVILTESEVWRLIDSSEVFRIKEFLDLKITKEWQQSGKLINTTPADEEEIETFAEKSDVSGFTKSDFSLFKHPRIEFPSFPNEWSPEMLSDAGRLTLDAAENFFARAGWSIKDATPFNVLFQGAKPVFVDLLSFEKRNEKSPIWLPYNQFVQTFLLPLLANRETGLTLEKIFLANRDGLPVSEAARFFGGIKKLKPEIFSLVTLPNLLTKRAETDARLYEPKTMASAEKAGFVLRQSFRRLRKQLEKISLPEPVESNWTGYTEINRETIPDYMQAKREFVARAIDELKPKNVLDVGCNTGFFSFLAARSGASVVAIDNDPAVVGRVFRAAKRENPDVLPLVVDLARPTPALGWRYSENPSFLDRAAGRFDLALMLAVVHHLLAHERIPLGEILRLAADLTKDALVVEFVPPTDKLFMRLARGREYLYRDLTTDGFLRQAEKFFRITRSQNLPQTERQIYLMRKK